MTDRVHKSDFNTQIKPKEKITRLWINLQHTVRCIYPCKRYLHKHPINLWITTYGTKYNCHFWDVYKNWCESNCSGETSS